MLIIVSKRSGINSARAIAISVMSRTIDLPNLKKVKYEQDLVSILVTRQTQQPVVVLVSMQKCDPCAAIKPRFIDFARKNIGVFCVYVCIDEFDNKQDLMQQTGNRFPTFMLSYHGRTSIVPASLENMQSVLNGMLKDPVLQAPVVPTPHVPHKTQPVCVDGVCALPEPRIKAQPVAAQIFTVTEQSQEPTIKHNKHKNKTKEHKEHIAASKKADKKKARRLATPSSSENSSSETDSDIDDKTKDSGSSSDDSTGDSLDTDELFEKLKQKDPVPAQAATIPALPAEFQSQINVMNQIRQNIMHWRNQPNLNPEMQASLMQQQAYLQACENKLRADMGRDERTRMIVEMQTKQDAAIQENQKRNAIIQQQQNMMNGLMMQPGMPVYQPGGYPMQQQQGMGMARPGYQQPMQNMIGQNQNPMQNMIGQNQNPAQQQQRTMMQNPAQQQQRPMQGQQQGYQQGGYPMQQQQGQMRQQQGQAPMRPPQQMMSR
jgi:hypothetical protein